MDYLREISVIHNNSSETKTIGRKSSFGCFKEINRNKNGRFRTNFKINPRNSAVGSNSNLFLKNSSTFDNKSFLNTKKLTLRKINTFVNLDSIVNSDIFVDQEVIDFPNPKLSKFNTIFQCKNIRD